MQKLFIIFFFWLFINPLFANVDITQEDLDKKLNLMLFKFSSMDYKERGNNFKEFLIELNQFKSFSGYQLYLARAYLLYSSKNKENLGMAIKIVKEYLKENSTSAEAWIVFAQIYVEQINPFTLLWGKFDKIEDKKDIEFRNKALQCIDKAFAINSNLSEGYFLQGMLSSGETRIGYFNKSIEINDKDNRIWRELIFELYFTNKYDEAILKLLIWQSIIDENDLELRIEIFKRFGDIFKEKREYNISLVWLEKALESRIQTGEDALGMMHSGIDDIYLSMAEVYSKLNKNDQVQIYYQRYLSFHPKSTWIRFKLAYSYAEQGGKDKAIVEYEQVLAYDQNHTSSLYNLALLLKESDKERAKQLFKRYLDLKIDEDSKESKLWVEKAKSNLEDLGEYESVKSKVEVWEQRKKLFIVILASLIGILLLVSLVFFSIKYKEISKIIIIFLMAVGIVLICLNEAESYKPNMGRVILYIISIITTGGCFLYLLRKKR
jgi:hypothetical protein